MLLFRRITRQIVNWFVLSPATRWDMAAQALWFDGYDAMEIHRALGP